jgi:hypothetical protein
MVWRLLGQGFETEPEADIIKTIDVLCDGAPNKASRFFSSA